MKSVLYISYDGMTDPLGQSQVLPYLIGLSKEGYRINLISFEKGTALKQEINTIDKICHRSNIKWTALNYTKNPPVVSTFLDIITMYKKAKKICVEENVQIVHCRSYISALVGLRLKRNLGTKFIFDMRGFWADERMDGGLWKLSNPLYNRIYRFFKKKEKEFVREADYIISLTQIGKQEIRSWGVIDNSIDKIKVIPCCVDENLFTPGEPNPLLAEKLGITSNDLVLSYLGSIGTWYLLDEMLMFYKQLVEVKTNAKFLFITPDHPDTIISKAAELGINRSKLIIVKAKRSEVPDLLKLSTVAIFFIKPLYSKKASSPTKQAEVLSMGIPIICNSNIGDTDEIILNNGLGIVLTDFTSKSISAAVSRIDDLMAIPESKMRNQVIKQFTLEGGIKKYKEVYESLV